MIDRIQETGRTHIKTGWPVVISSGISGGATQTWSVYLRKPNGSLQRCKQFKVWPTVEEAWKELRNYQGKAW